MKRNDVFLFVFSFIVTLLVWLYLADPAQTEERNVPLSIKLAKGMAAIYPQETVIVIVSGTATSMSRLKTEELQAVVDMTGVTTEGTYSGNVRVTGPKSLDLTYTPKQGLVRLSLEQEATKAFPVEFDRPGPNGETATTTPPNVLVTGPKTVIDRVFRAVIDYDLGKPAGEQQTQWDVHLLARDREKITTLVVDPKTVQVDSLSIALAPRQMVVSPIRTGEPAAGYAAVNTEVRPPNVKVRFAPGQNLNLSSLSTTPVAIDNAKEDVTKEVEVVVPEGVHIIGDNKVTVTVKIVKIPGNESKGKN